MSQHVATPTPITGMKESTRRALRTAVQGLLAFSAFVIAVAIPPVADAINTILGLFPIDYKVGPAEVAAVGVFGTALAALATKIQNLVEGRDKIASRDELLTQVAELGHLVEAVVEAAKQAGAAITVVRHPNGYEVVADTSGATQSTITNTSTGEPEGV